MSIADVDPVEALDQEIKETEKTQKTKLKHFKTQTKKLTQEWEEATKAKKAIQAEWDQKEAEKTQQLVEVHTKYLEQQKVIGKQRF